MKKNNKSIYTVLDIGSSKIACLMVRMAEGMAPEVIAHSSVQAKGIQNGTIWNVEEAKLCVDNALRQVEKQAGRRISGVYVNISSSQMKSIQLYDEMDIPNGRVITSDDVKQLVDGMLNTHIAPDEEILHVIPIGYSVNHEHGRVDPCGIYGHTLGARIHVITIPQTQVMNLLKVLDWCHVTVLAKVATPYACALAVLSEEEMIVGTTVIDFGADLTSYAIFVGGGLMQLGLVPHGGNEMTLKVAQTFKTTLQSAEREKIVRGAAMLAPKDGLEPIIFPILKDEAGGNIQVMRSQLVETILPCLDNILDELKNELEENDTFSSVAKHYVLTGGGAGFDNLTEKVGAVLGGIARLGKFQFIKNLPNDCDSCRLNVCVGLLVYAKMQMQSETMDNFQEKSARNGWLRKVTEWLKQNL